MGKTRVIIGADHSFYKHCQRVKRRLGRDATIYWQTSILGKALESMTDDQIDQFYMPKTVLPSRRRMRSGRKGQLEVIKFPLWMFVAAILLVVAIIFANNLASMLSGPGMNQLDPSAVETSQRVLGGMPTILDFLGVGLAFAFIIASAIVSSRIPTSPIFAIILLPLLLVGTYMAFQMGDAWESLEANSVGAMATALADASYTSFLVRHSLWYWLLAWVVSGIAFFGASSKGGGSQNAY